MFAFNIVCRRGNGHMPRGRPRKNLDLNLASIREMRTREEKLRAIFTDELKPIPEEKRRLQIALRGEVVDDLMMIRYLSEADTWKFVPEEVAELLFERIVKTTQFRDDDGKKVETLSDSAIVHMAVRLLRLYLQGANPWNRKLIPKILQVDRDVVSRTVFMKRAKHGADMDAIRRMVNGVDSSDDILYDDVDWDSL
jgi:hypothetical protein